MFCQRHPSKPIKCPCMNLCVDCRGCVSYECPCDKQAAKQALERLQNQQKAEVEEKEKLAAEQERLTKLARFEEIKQKIEKRRTAAREEELSKVIEQAKNEARSETIGVALDLSQAKSIREKQLEAQIKAQDDMMKKIQADYAKRLEEMKLSMEERLKEINNKLQEDQDISERPDNLAEDLAQNIQKQISENLSKIKEIEVKAKSERQERRLSALSKGGSPNLSGAGNPRRIPQKSKSQNSLTKKAVQRLNGASKQDLPRLESSEDR